MPTLPFTHLLVGNLFNFFGYQHLHMWNMGIQIPIASHGQESKTLCCLWLNGTGEAWEKTAGLSWVK
jgi:hypothetical protein